MLETIETYIGERKRDKSVEPGKPALLAVIPLRLPLLRFTCRIAHANTHLLRAP